MYNFRPVNNELFEICASNDFCTNCPMRLGCKIRYDFYADSLDFEISLQLSEIYLLTREHISSDLAFEASNHMRIKRNMEVRLNPVFSYS